MAGLIRETIYSDADNGIVVFVDRFVVDAPTSGSHPPAGGANRRQELLAKLQNAITRAEHWTKELPDVASPLKLGNNSLSLSDDLPSDEKAERVYLRIKPAPVKGDGPPPDGAAFFTLLSGLISDGNSDPVACEIRATDQTITFQVGVHPDFASILEQQLYAYYPVALIERCVPETPQNSVLPHAAASLQFTPEDGRLRLTADQAADPLYALLEVLGTAQPDDALVIQLLISPLEAKKSLLLHAAAFVGGAFRERFVPQATADKDPKISKADEAIARVNLRLLATAKTAARAKQLLGEAIAPFYQWTAAGGAQLKRVNVSNPARLATMVATGKPEGKTSFMVTATELASLYHLPDNPRAFPRLAALSSVHLAPPRHDHAGHGLELGSSRYRNRLEPVIIAPEDRLRHLYLIGQTGTGKSTLFQSLFLQDVVAGEGACYIDPHGEAIDWLLARIPKNRLKDVVLFDPSHSEAILGLNLLEWRTPEERDLLIQELILLFYKLFDPERAGIIGPQFEHWLRSAALTITEPTIRGTLADIPRLFTDQTYQRWAVARVTHPAAKSFWQDQMAQTASFHKSEMLNYFTSKFGAFLGNTTMQTILGQQQSAFDLRTLMDRRKILLVNLSKGKLGDLNAQLLGTLLVTKIQMAALSRANIPVEQRVPFYVYIDEFHTVATDSFASLLSEIRKYGVALHLTHQYVNQLSPKLKDAVVGNVGTLLALRLGHDDANWLAGYFAPLSPDDLTHIAAYHAHCKTLHQGTVSAPFTLQTFRAQVPVIPQTEVIIRARMEAAALLVQLSATQAQISAN